MDGVLEAFGLGVVAQSSLLLAGLLVCWVTVPPESSGPRRLIATGFPVSPSFVSAVFVSNIPQAIAPSADLAQAAGDRAARPTLAPGG
jgi:hypothetical protein